MRSVAHRVNLAEAGFQSSKIKSPVEIRSMYKLMQRSFLVLCTSLLSLSSQAQPTEVAVCNGALVPSEEEIRSDARLMQAYVFSNAEYEFDRLRNLDNTSRNADAGFKYFSAEYSESQTKEQFSEKVRNRLQTEGFSLSKTDARSYYRRGLTDGQLAKWLGCVTIMSGQGALLLTPRSISSDSFVLTVSRKFPLGVGQGEVEIGLVGGSVRGVTTIKEIYQGPGSKSYAVRAAKANSRVTIIANLPGFSDSIVVDLQTQPATGISAAAPPKRFELVSLPVGDCDSRTLQLRDPFLDRVMTIKVAAASSTVTNCTWIDWTGTPYQVANSVATAIGLDGANFRYALLSYAGDCNSRQFTILDKRSNTIFNRTLANNCARINFTSSPARTAEQVCAIPGLCN